MKSLVSKKEWLYYMSSVIICGIIMVFVMQLWDADLYIPFNNSGDALFSKVVIKTLIENGTYNINGNLGAPFQSELFDFPLGTDNFNFLLLKLISLFNSDAIYVTNFFYLFTFFLAVITSMIAMRSLNISPLIAIVGSQLFAFLPYHFYRGQGHLFLSGYYVIPLIVLLITWIGNDKFEHDSYIWKSKRLYYGIIICAIASSSGIYYAFFGCFFLLVAALCKFVEFSKANKKTIVISLLFIATIVLGIVINNAPSILYKQEHGANETVGVRSTIETEIYGLKIDQLVMPVNGHRISKFAEWREKYDSSAPLANENGASSLGIIGAAGFCMLLFLLLFIGNKNKNEALEQLSILNISAILLSSVGGFSFYFAALISPSIRAYNRISIYIGYFSILAVVIVAQMIKEKYITSKFRSYCFSFSLILLLMIGILDQTVPSMVPDYNGNKKSYLQDAKYIKSIEDLLPNGSLVFQLPYVPFPENPPVHRMVDYDLFKGYIHSHSLKWSYGAMKGREADIWYRDTSSKPVNELVLNLSYAGFAGIYIDRYGYEDSGVGLENQIKDVLKEEPLVSQDGRLAFYSMKSYNERLASSVSKEVWKEHRESVLYPVTTEWGQGFYGLEGAEDNNWRWSSKSSEFVLNNPSKNTKKLDMKMTFRTGSEAFSKLKIKSDLFQEEITLNNEGYEFIKSISIPPGRHSISFESDASKVVAPTDPRELVFAVYNYTLK
ncbi:hypothetical protein QJQ58_25320 [Paenibacillus dendritiformis]|uniref:hypothetical protein n=1 Tax=Paenibacillus dendritiformis TaxID=130049 RepID=UPI00248C825F|nr:hypothetical protein [Paenibacillus dendritiformis]WGU93814.1 hypothetical protein QJQ58_25320 [Paenibacillus dendritiformis]